MTAQHSFLTSIFVYFRKMPSFESSGIRFDDIDATIKKVRALHHPYTKMFT